MSTRPRLAFLVLVALAVSVTSCGTVNESDLEPSSNTDGASTVATADLVDANSADETTTSTRPITTTTTEPPTTTTTAPPKRRLVVHGSGDVNLDPGYITAFQSQGFGIALDGLDGLFANDDLTVINLECAASSLGSREPKQFNFRCDSEEALSQIKKDGVDVANLGNNHSGDYGKDALVDSRASLEAAGIAPVGVGVDAAEASKPALFEINGWTIAVIGFGGVVPQPNWIATDDRPGMADGDTIETMVAAVEAADELADLVIVSLHWGRELDLGPVPEDVERAEAMIAAGADAIFGHHQHRLQPMELVDGVPVAWGLGNFVWPRFSEAGADTGVARVVFEPDGTVISCLLDATIVSSGHPVLDDPDTTTCPDE